NQKLYLWNYSALRSRALLLSLTSILPVLIIGIRWPATFGDISAAGSFLTNFMFRVVHLVFLVFCILVAFDIALSPRALGYGLPFLTFYFLGALSVGYFTGYVLLVFSEVKLKSWQRRSGLSTLVHRLVYAAVWAGFIAAPAGLIYKNFPVIRELNGPTLHDWAAMTSEQLPKEGSLVLSDDIFQLHLIEAYYGRHGQPNPHMMVHTRSLTFPVYHRQLSKKYPQRWTSLADGDVKEPVETLALIQALSQMARTGSVHYLHPSFGYYFERLHAEPRGIVQQLHEYTADQFFPPPLTSAVESLNQKFWADHKAQIDRLTPPRARQIKDADFVAKLYSRAINAWGVRLQRNGRLEEAKNLFEWSFQLNTNNFAALVNRESNRSLRTGQSRRIDKETEQKFANLFQSWENMLAENGPFDDADFCFKLGEIFNSQSLFRQAAIELNRTVQLEPENLQARFALANIYLTSQRPDKVFEIVNDIRAHAAARPLSITNQLELVQFEAGAHFVKTNIDTAEKLLKDALASHPDHLGLFDSLLQVYTLSGRVTNAIQLLDSRLQRHPGNASLLVQKANLFMTLKDWDAAVAVADQMLKNAPDDSQAKLLKGLALLQAKRFEPARAIFEGLRKDDPKHIDALLSLGAIYLEEKNYAKAIEVLDTVLEENRGHWAALRNRAIAHLKLGHYDEARRDYRAILQIVPRYTAAYYGLGEIAYQEKDRDEAIRYYELYLKHFPQSDSTELAEEKKMVTARLNELKAVER
ncbi:MAG: tetratricopeptide repeat protein, partial [Verrucomicrobiota bacterium]